MFSTPTVQVAIQSDGGEGSLPGHFGQLYRHPQQNRNVIGGNDLWIAATALAYGLPLVTVNEEHYNRIPQLEIVSYK